MQRGCGQSGNTVQRVRCSWPRDSLSRRICWPRTLQKAERGLAGEWGERAVLGQASGWVRTSSRARCNPAAPLKRYIHVGSAALPPKHHAATPCSNSHAVDERPDGHHDQVQHVEAGAPPGEELAGPELEGQHALSLPCTWLHRFE